MSKPPARLIPGRGAASDSSEVEAERPFGGARAGASLTRPARWCRASAGARVDRVGRDLLDGGVARLKWAQSKTMPRL
eukprot:2945332-Pyramimonas_sp.AAC.1